MVCASRKLSHRNSRPAVTRRQWLQVCAVGCAALWAAPGSVPALTGQGAQLGAKLDVQALPWMDAHSHVWSPDVQSWPLAGQQRQADLKPLSFKPEELLKLAEPEKV